jgi:hypothetical protein
MRGRYMKSSLNFHHPDGMGCSTDHACSTHFPAHAGIKNTIGMTSIDHENFNTFCSSLSPTCSFEANAPRDIDFTLMGAFKGD